MIKVIPHVTRLGTLTLALVAGACGAPEVDSRIECNAAEPCPGFMRCEADGFCANPAPIDASVGGGFVDAADVPSVDADTTIALEAEAHTRSESLDGDVHAWEPKTDKEGFQGDGFVIVLPDDATACVDVPVVGCGALLGYDVNIVEPGSYYLHVRTMAANGDNNSLHYGVDGAFNASHNVAQDSTWTWSTNPNGRLELTAGAHELIVWMREDGLRIDALVLSKDPISPL